MSFKTQNVTTGNTDLSLNASNGNEHEPHRSRFTRRLVYVLLLENESFDSLRFMQCDDTRAT